MDDIMNDDFEDIENMGKDDLIALCELKSVEFDGRWSAARIREALMAAMNNPEGNAPVTLEIVAPNLPPVESIDSIIYEWAASFCDGLELAYIDDGVITIKTKHGTVTAPLDGAATKEKLAAIKAEITGE